MSPKRRKRRAPKRGTPKPRKGTQRGKRGATAHSNKRGAPKKSRTVKRAAKKAAKKAPRPVVKPAAKSKARLRIKLRARRSQLGHDQRQAAAQRVLANLTAARPFLVSRRVACYLPTDGEVDTRALIDRIRRMNKTVYLPVLPRLRRDRLWFGAARPETELAPNRFGILEPRVPPRELLRADDLDLILLPVVAFDNRGNRVGRGAGFYDRSLAFLRHRRFLRKPRLLGLAYDFQRVPKIITDPWDVALDGVITDQAAYYRKS